MDGLTKTMYAIVMKVVNPARISVRQSVCNDAKSKYCSAHRKRDAISNLCENSMLRPYVPASGGRGCCAVARRISQDEARRLTGSRRPGDAIDRGRDRPARNAPNAGQLGERRVARLVRSSRRAD